jgi:hypothetical protein
MTSTGERDAPARVSRRNWAALAVVAVVATVLMICAGDPGWWKPAALWTAGLTVSAVVVRLLNRSATRQSIRR